MRDREQHGRPSGQVQAVERRARRCWGMDLRAFCLLSMAHTVDQAPFDVELHPSNQFSLNERFHISDVVVGESSMPQGQIQWNSGRWACILSDGLCHTVQKHSIVLIDGGDEQWWSFRVTEGHMDGLDMYING